MQSYPENHKYIGYISGANMQIPEHWKEKINCHNNEWRVKLDSSQVQFAALLLTECFRACQPQLSLDRFKVWSLINGSVQNILPILHRENAHPNGARPCAKDQSFTEQWNCTKIRKCIDQPPGKQNASLVCMVNLRELTLIQVTKGLKCCLHLRQHC